MSLIALTLTLALAGVQPDSTRAPAPAPSCLDARAVTEVRTLDAIQLLIRAGGKRYRLATGEACPGTEYGAALLAEHGWVCGGAREFVRTPSHLCPIARVEPLAARDYARLQREADAALLARNATLLQPVESRARRDASKGFIGTYDYCFKPSQVRSWSATPDAIIVHTSKLRSGGNGRYRVEFSGNCPEAAFNNELVLRSGIGLDLICGNPGDIAELRRGLGQPMNTGFGSSASSLTLETGANSAAGIGVRGCRIEEVYPIDS